jgi:hypothetical protein
MMALRDRACSLAHARQQYCFVAWQRSKGHLHVSSNSCVAYCHIRGVSPSNGTHDDSEQLQQLREKQSRLCHTVAELAR